MESNVDLYRSGSPYFKSFFKKSSDFTEISKCIPEHQLISDFRDWSVQKLDRQEKEQGKVSELKGAAKV